MAEMIKIESFPAGKVGVARETLAKLFDKLSKAAGKAGATAPVAPSLTVENFRTVVRCGSCGVSGVSGSKVGLDCGFCENGYSVEASLVDLLVTADRPALAGWEFLAVVEPMDGGNMVRRVPGSDTEFDLTAYRTGDALSCEHCDTVRRRTETFVVKSDGSDPAVPAGVVKRVGRNCLSSFLGGLSPAALLARLTWEKVLRGVADEESSGGGSRERTFEPVPFLAWTCGVVRVKGWTSKGAAAAYNEAAGDGGNKVPTVYRVLSLLGDPPRDRYERAEWLALRKECEPTEFDTCKAGKVLEWAMNLSGTSDYEYNLALVARQAVVEPRNAGLLASAVGSYDRAMGAEAKKAAEKLDKVPAPTGKDIEFEGEVVSTKVVESQWGASVKMTVKVTTESGVWMAWGTIPADLLRIQHDGYWTTAEHETLVGRKLSIKATLEAGKDDHFVFMKRPKADFIDILGPVYVAPKPPKKPRAKKVAAEVA